MKILVFFATQYERAKFWNDAKKARYAIKVTMFILIVITCIGTALFFKNHQFFVIATARMRPTLPVGSVHVVEKVDENTEYEVGDMVVYFTYLEGRFYSKVPSRIIAFEDEWIYLKGDGNENRDPYVITRSSILFKFEKQNIFSFLTPIKSENS